MAAGATRADLKDVLDHSLFAALTFPRARAEALFDALQAAGEAPIAELAAGLGSNPALTARMAALLMKASLARPAE